MSNQSCAVRLRTLLILFLVTATTWSHAEAQEKVSWLEVPEGFEVTQFANDELATDIFCMTFDSKGRCVVAGPGYIKVLIDNDQDGTADNAQLFYGAFPAGVQGMYFDGNDLLCTGGQGMMRLADRNGDSRADGSPQKILSVKTGGEHHAHAIRKGPDGRFYMIAGNFSGLNASTLTSPNSPVKNPESGVILRLNKNFMGREIVVDGFRNAYDFAFNSYGDMFTYDSDGERDISLPWYRPTRVFQCSPASHAGWISRSWKRPNYYFDMPPVLAETGRGSPTGVATYRHTQFPKNFDDSIFVLDWTFGRVINVQTAENKGGYSSTPSLFMKGKGAFGFAPTDAEIGPDGSLYVSVGGRNTRGGVYRVTYVGQQKEITQTNNSNVELAAVLDAPQPLSSWSRANWEPKAKKLGREAFLKAITDDSFSSKQQVRAVEILVDVFNGIRAGQTAQVLKVTRPEVMARIGWLFANSGNPATFDSEIAEVLKVGNPLVQRVAVESLVGQASVGPKTRQALLKCLHNDNRVVRQSAFQFLNSTSVVIQRNTAAEKPEDYKPSEWLAVVARRHQYKSQPLQAGLVFFSNATTELDQLDAIRCVQMSLGDIGPGRTNAGVFEGYSSKSNFDLNAVTSINRQFKKVFGVGEKSSELVDFEIARVLGMIESGDSELFQSVVNKMVSSKHPVDQIHYLIVAARMKAPRSANQSKSIASVIAGLQGKIDELELNQDNNWVPRIKEMWQALIQKDPRLISSVLSDPNFGSPAHTLFLDFVTGQQRVDAISKIIQKIESKKLGWNEQLVRIVATSPSQSQRSLVRKQFDNPELRAEVILVLAQNVQLSDRDKFVTGLTLPQYDVIERSLDALLRLPSSKEEAEQIALAKLLVRMGADRREFGIREKTVRLLQRNLGRSFGFQYGQGGHRPQNVVVQKWTDEVQRIYPNAKAALTENQEMSDAEILALLKTVPWQNGNAVRGKAVFTATSCEKCHGKRTRLGPDLAGVAKRFSREDLFRTILDPSRQVSSRYQAKLFETIEGKSFSGIVIYEAVDGVLLRTENNETIRLEKSEIENSSPLSKSLMPAGLLKEIELQQYADLYEYLKSL